MPIQLELDENGNIFTRPVTGWLTATVAGIGVVLGIEYVDTPEALEKDECKSIQFSLTPQQCLLDLSGLLTKRANQLLAPATPEEPVN